MHNRKPLPFALDQLFVNTRFRKAIKNLQIHSIDTVRRAENKTEKQTKTTKNAEKEITKKPVSFAKRTVKSQLRRLYQLVKESGFKAKATTMFHSSIKKGT